MIDEIVQKITEEKNNLIAQAFTSQIGSLLISNGIVPIMREYTQNDMKTIMDSDRYKLVMEFGVAFDELDTTEHDKKIKADAIEPIMRGIDDFRTLERKMCKYFNEVDMNKEKDDLERLALDIICHGMQTIGCLIQELDLINYQAKEQKDE